MNYNIASYHRGLGDELQISTLPELLTSRGHEVKLYVGPDVLPFRNKGIKDFVWGYNPYIYKTGYPNQWFETTENWNCGDIPGKPYINRHDDFIRNWECHYGMPENSLPKIYYTPKERYRTEIDHGPIEGIIELSCITMKYNSARIIEMAREIIKSSGMNFRIIDNPHQNNPIQLPELNKISPNSLEQMSDIMHNCKMFISLNSGLHSLAAAVQRFGKFEQTCFLPDSRWDEVMADKKFTYPGVNYVKE